MYAMFGMTDVARATQTGRGNLAAAMIAMMTTYGVILVGATLSVERTTGISLAVTLTPIQPWVILLVRLTALVALRRVHHAYHLRFGMATGAEMTTGRVDRQRRGAIHRIGPGCTHRTGLRIHDQGENATAPPRSSC